MTLIAPPQQPPTQLVPYGADPKSQYLAAALHALQQQPQTSPGSVASGLMAQALMTYAQNRQQQQAAQYGSNGGNAQKNAMTDQMNAGLQSIGQTPVAGSPLPTTAPQTPAGGLLGLGRQALSGLGSLFGGNQTPGGN